MLASNVERSALGVSQIPSPRTSPSATAGHVCLMKNSVLRDGYAKGTQAIKENRDVGGSHRINIQQNPVSISLAIKSLGFAKKSVRQPSVWS
jgi:hypothetical protein